jgi:hypothetical protein
MAALAVQIAAERRRLEKTSAQVAQYAQALGCPTCGAWWEVGTAPHQRLAKERIRLRLVAGAAWRREERRRLERDEERRARRVATHGEPGD